MLLEPLAAFAILTSFADNFFSGIRASGRAIGSASPLEKSSTDLTRFNVLCSNSTKDFRLFPGCVDCAFSKPRRCDNFSQRSIVKYSLRIPNAYDRNSPSRDHKESQINHYRWRRSSINVMKIAGAFITVLIFIFEFFRFNVVHGFGTDVETTLFERIG